MTIYNQRIELSSWDIPAADNKSPKCCCINSWLTMINPDYNMIEQLCIKSIYDKIIQNHHQIKRSHLLAWIVMSRIFPQ